ncbi:ABC transporter permease [Salininema proteolyticum]|uniref:ABC transporter permease n=1 Tax=Salininema proteolyticum TaxID=1607685 RepID=A0ABV8TV41_9ACTN
MLKYSIRRLLIMIPVILAASFITFTLSSMSTDPVETYRVTLQQQAGERDLKPEDVENSVELYAQKYYYDRSFPERYWLWLTGFGDDRGDMGIIQGEFGPSTRGDSFDIGSELAKRVYPTFKLIFAGSVFSIGLAMIFGVISAVRQYRMVDYVLTTVGFVCLAMPTFWFAAVVKGLGVSFNKSTDTSFFGTVNDRSQAGTADFTTFDHFMDQLGHLVLPTIVLMLTGYAAASRYQRSAMLEVLHSDYVRLARAKGVPNRTVVRRHALRNALIPMATLAPAAIVLSITGAILTEAIFNWDGMGRFFSTSLTRGDTFAIQAFLIFSGVLTVIAVLISDLLYGVLDPRIRYE